MSTAATTVSNFFNQNLYGFLLLLIAAFFFYHKDNEAAQAFSYIGSALMGIRQLTPPIPPTIQTDSMNNATIKTGN